MKRTVRLASHDKYRASFLTEDRSWIGALGPNKHVVLLCEQLIYTDVHDGTLGEALTNSTTAALFVKSAEYSGLLDAPVPVPEDTSDPLIAAADLASALPLANEIFGDGIGDRQLSAGDKEILKKAEESATSLVRENACFCVPSALQKQSLCASGGRRLVLVYDVKMTACASVKDGPPVLIEQHLRDALRAAVAARGPGGPALSPGDVIIILGGRGRGSAAAQHSQVKRVADSVLGPLALNHEEFFIHHLQDQKLRPAAAECSALETALAYTVEAKDLSRARPARPNKHYKPADTQGSVCFVLPRACIICQAM